MTTWILDFYNLARGTFIDRTVLTHQEFIYFCRAAGTAFPYLASAMVITRVTGDRR